MTAKYRFDGGKVIVRFAILFGLGCAVGFNPAVSLPVESESPLSAFAGHDGLGSMNLAGNVYPMIAVADGMSTTTFRPFAFDATTSGYRLLGASSPNVWSPGSSMSIEFSYYPADPVEPATFGAVGDSMTAWESTQNPFGLSQSWTEFVPADGLAFAGGWAQGGATTGWLADNPREVLADALVILAGVNDVHQGVPQAATLTNIARIVDAASVDRVVLCALAPYDANPAAALALNAAYETLAYQNGWEFIDPYASARTSTGVYSMAAAVDGVHPTTTTQQTAAGIIRGALVGAS